MLNLSAAQASEVVAFLAQLEQEFAKVPQLDAALKAPRQRMLNAQKAAAMKALAAKQAAAR